MPGETLRVGYVLKRYPRYSETFIVNEILAHEAAGLEIEIFALRPINDTHFQDAIARVKAPVNYIPATVPHILSLRDYSQGTSLLRLFRMRLCLQRPAS